MNDACERAGCTGHYAADGYCDECGHKQVAVPAPRSGKGSKAKRGAARTVEPAPTGTGATSPVSSRAGVALGSATRAGVAAGGATRTGAAAGGATRAGVAVSGATRTGVAVGGATRASTSATTTGPRTGATRTTGRSRTAGRGRLGANLVEVPPVPLRDPTTAVQTDPCVPEVAAVLRQVRRAGRPGAGRQARPCRAASVPRTGRRSRSCPASPRASWSTTGTRSSARSPTAAWAGSTWPGTATSASSGGATAGSCSRA